MSEVPQEERGRIEIVAPTSSIEFEVPDGVWDDLETYLFTGFLTVSADVQDVHFTFKTLNSNELRNISYMRIHDTQSKDFSNRFRALFIAHSVFMVNGMNFLHKRDDNINKLVKMISKYPAPVLDKILLNLSVLNDKAQRVYPLVEAYSWENRSRFKFANFRNSPINSVVNTGLAGTDELGPNACQSTWISLNHIHDQKDLMEREWGNAKFIGGCFVGKGMRSVEERDKNRKETEQIERDKMRMKVINEYLNRLNVKDLGPKEFYTLPDGRKAEVASRYKAHSADELAKELSSALNNEKDAHDLAIENHLRKLQERAVQIETESRKIRNANVGPSFPDGSQFLDRKAAEERLKRMRESILDREKGMTPEG